MPDRRSNISNSNRENLSGFAQNTGLAVIVMVVFLVVWQLAVVVSNVHPIILPSPLRVLQVAWQERQALAIGYVVTGVCALIALLVSISLGSIIAIVFSQSARIRAAFQPYVVFLQTVPIVAIAPLLITWFGYGLATVILVATIISLFPIISNVTAGLTSVDRNLVELFQLNGAGRIKTLLKLRIPFAVSHLVLGTRISSGMTVIGAIIGELFVGTSAQYAGLGKLMMGWQILARTDALIAVVLTSTLLGISMLGFVNLTSRLFLRRWMVSSGFEMQS